MRCFALAALAMLAVTSAHATTLLATIERDYGNQPGEIDPYGADALFSDLVVVSQASDPRFGDTVSLDGVSFETLDRIDVTLVYSEANGSASFDSEDWFFTLFGTTPATPDDNYRAELPDQASALVRLDPSIDDMPSVNAWAGILSRNAVAFGFSEGTPGTDEFRLNSVTLEVYGTPTVIPAPAGVPLLLAGIGALATLRHGRSGIAQFRAGRHAPLAAGAQAGQG